MFTMFQCQWTLYFLPNVTITVFHTFEEVQKLRMGWATFLLNKHSFMAQLHLTFTESNSQGSRPTD